MWAHEVQRLPRGAARDPGQGALTEAWPGPHPTRAALAELPPRCCPAALGTNPPELPSGSAQPERESQRCPCLGRPLPWHPSSGMTTSPSLASLNNHAAGTVPAARRWEHAEGSGSLWFTLISTWKIRGWVTQRRPTRAGAQEETCQLSTGLFF